MKFSYSNISTFAQCPYKWRKRKNPKAINGKTLYKIMSTMADKYNVSWEFTSKQNCGKRIVELLT